MKTQRYHASPNHRDLKQPATMVAPITTRIDNNSTLPRYNEALRSPCGDKSAGGHRAVRDTRWQHLAVKNYCSFSSILIADPRGLISDRRSLQVIMGGIALSKRPTTGRRIGSFWHQRFSVDFSGHHMQDLTRLW